MNKKDRIAVVMSIALVLLGLLNSTWGNDIGYLIFGVVFIYWAYRFIKNDISFLKMKDQ
ncbi:hypothetical protein [Acinetobacter venetianus]|uniref:hypothetical protein n=1 Tax=Acinetobacter venetianus TaxID=52133 RepID=UPI00241DC460|nr:hypothetical protein [Acinetobacter venetianus]